MHIGLYFGSFNPVHVGHLIVADHMAQYAGMDKVLLVVSPQNPFKSPKSLAHEHDRVEMVRLATYGSLRLEVSDVELRLPKPSYTINTMRYLAEKRPTDTFSLIMGEDNLTHLAKWREVEELLKRLENILLSQEPGGEVKLEEDLLKTGTIHKVNAPLLNLSASVIRTRIQENKQISYLVPEAVERYIENKSLYR